MKKIVIALSLIAASITVGYSLTNITIIGDSLSDQGLLLKETLGKGLSTKTYYYGRFTNQPGNWVDYLQNEYNHKGLISSNNNKDSFITNYSIGGATLHNHSAHHKIISKYYQSIYDLVHIFTSSADKEIHKFIKNTNKKQRKDTLVVMFAGSNDFLWAGAWDQGNTPFAKNMFQANYVKIRENMQKSFITYVDELSKSGVNNILILGLPDLTVTPAIKYFGVDAEKKAIISQNILAYNQFLQDYSKNNDLHRNMNIEYLDINNIFMEGLKDPRFTNNSDSCLSPRIKDNVLEAGEFSPKECDYTNLFWDEVHPTTTTHYILFRNIFDFINSKYTFENEEATNTYNKLIFKLDNKANILSIDIKYKDNNSKSHIKTLTQGKSTTLYVKDNEKVTLETKNILGKTYLTTYTFEGTSCEDHLKLFNMMKDKGFDEVCKNGIINISGSPEKVDINTHHYRVPIINIPVGNEYQ